MNQKMRYGLSRADMASLLEGQSSLCGICSTLLEDGKNLCVDRDHETGKVRGLLCRSCNTALGGFKDKPALIENSLSYLGNRGAYRPKLHSIWLSQVHDKDGNLKYNSAWHSNLTTDTAVGYTNRRDFESKALANVSGSTNAFASGNATSTTATTLVNSGATFPTTASSQNPWLGSIVACGPNASGTGAISWGIIITVAATTLTVDQWYSSITMAPGTQPNATCSYQVLPGQAPAAWMAVTSSVFTPAASDTTLAGELTTSGFTRAEGTYAHTAAATTYTLQHVWTASGTQTINNEAVFNAGVSTGGAMPFESAEPSPPTLVSGDTLTQTVTVTVG
jgi:Recombination endonuclease VII